MACAGVCSSAAWTLQWRAACLVDEGKTLATRLVSARLPRPLAPPNPTSPLFLLLILWWVRLLSVSLRSHYRCRTSAKGLTRVHPHYRVLQAEVSAPKAHQWVQRDKPEVMSVACHALRVRCLLAIARILALLNVFLFAHANH